MVQDGSVGTQPPVSKPTTVSSQNAHGPPLSSTSFDESTNDQSASPSTAAVARRHTNDINEPPGPEPVASSDFDTGAAQSQTDTNGVDLPAAKRRDPATGQTTANNFVLPAAISPPAQGRLPITVVEQSISLGLSAAKKTPARSGQLKLQKLEKKEYVDLEDLAKMTELKQIVKEKERGSESQQSTTNNAKVSACSSISGGGRSLADEMITANSALIASLSARTQTKFSRPGSERKERDESWQKYLKRSVYHYYKHTV